MTNRTGAKQTISKLTLTQKRASKAVKKVDNFDQPVKGTTLYIIYTILKSLSFVFVNYLYEFNTVEGDPDSPKNLSPYQLLFARSAVSLTFMLMWLNINLKKNVYDGINRTNVTPLIFRTLQGTISNFINYSVTKFIAASIVAVINQLSPIVTVVLAFFILKEVLKCFDSIIMGVNLLAILLTILGEQGTDGDEAAVMPPFPMWVVWVLTLVNPFLSAGGTIAMRKMAKFSEFTVSWYLNISTMLFALAFLGLTAGKEMFAVFAYFDWRSWILIVLAGTMTVVQ